jgi:hypothetical protein
MTTILIRMLAALVLAVTLAGGSLAAPPQTVDGVTRVHLDQHNGYFAARETLAGLKPGTYEFVVSNKAGKLAGFQLVNAAGEELDRFPLEPGETRTSRVEIGEGGFRYRCPINPTPWYEVSVGR